MTNFSKDIKKHTIKFSLHQKLIYFVLPHKLLSATYSKINSLIRQILPRQQHSTTSRFLKPRTRPSSSPFLRILRRRQPKRHIRTGRRQHHKLGIELHALNRPRMIAVQHANLVTRVGVPHVHPPIRTAREDKLRVRTERGLDRDALVVEVAWKRERNSGLEELSRTIRGDCSPVNVCSGVP